MTLRKRVNPEKQQHHYALLSDHVTESTVTGEKEKTFGEGHSGEVFPALPHRHNVKSRWEKPLLAPAKVDSGALNMK